jgi:hypothetical protein
VTLAPIVDRSSILFTRGVHTPDEVVYEEVHDDGPSTLFHARIARRRSRADG